MATEILIITVVPLLLYAFFEYRFGQKVALISAIIMTAGLGVWYTIRFDDFDPLFVLDVVILMVCGALSLKLKDTRFFKMQPAIMGGFMTVYLLASSWLDQPFFLRYKPMLYKINPEIVAQFSQEQFDAILVSLTYVFSLVIAGHTVLMIIAALKFSTPVWVLCRLLIYPALLTAMMFVFAV